MNRVSEVNRLLRLNGETVRLRRGRGYYYFDGAALVWPESSVCVNRADELTTGEWLREFARLRDAAKAAGREVR